MNRQLLMLLAGATGFHVDAGETAHLLRQLEFVKAQTYDILRATLKARQFIPVSHDAPAGAESITYRQWDEFSMATLIANYADDLPMADVAVKEFPIPVRSMGKAYQWSIQDLRNSAMNGSQLDTRRARSARMAVERFIDQIGAFGSANAGLPGFLNNANVPLIAPITGTWSTATSAQIIDDLNKLVQSIITVTKEVHTPNTLLLDTDSFGIISQKPVAVDNQTTVLQSFLANNPYIKNIDQWTRLNEADVAGTGPRVVAYDRDPMILQLEIPQEFEQFPPQARNLSFVVPCHARIGGVHMHYPLGVAYMDGV